MVPSYEWGRDPDAIPFRDVLIVEDDEVDRRSLEATLNEGLGGRIAIRWTATLKDTLAAIRERPPDAILLDLYLPDAADHAVVEAVTRAAPDSPVVVVTGKVQEETSIRAAFALGVQDWFSKEDLDPRILRRQLSHAVTRHHLAREHASARARADAQSRFRPLARRIVATLLQQGRPDLRRLQTVSLALATETDVESLDDGLAMYGAMGLGRLEVLEEAPEGHVKVRGTELLEEGLGDGNAPTCHLALGFLRGLIGHLDGDGPAQGMEVACRNQGDPACLFLVERQPSPATTAGADEAVQEGRP